MFRPLDFCMLILGSLLLLPIFLNAQEINYFESYKEDKILGRLLLTSKLNVIELDEEIDDVSKKITYKPADDFRIGLGVHYKWLGLSATLPFSNKKNDEFDGNNLDLQGQIILPFLIVEGTLFRYNGYSIDNAEDFPILDTYKDKVYDISFRSINTNIYYILNHNKYSYRSFKILTEKQKKSAGSAILGLFYNYSRLEAPGGIIPEEIKDQFSENMDISDENYNLTGISAGYAHNFVIKNNYSIGVLLSTGPGYFSENKKPLKKSTKTVDHFAFSTEFQLGAAYQGADYFYRFFVQVNAFNRTLDEEEQKINTIQGYINFQFGRRFNIPKKAKF